VLILTDDQRWDSLWAMPAVQQNLVDHGVTFRNGFVVNSLCCPSRASILTGDYSHTTGVYKNKSDYGGFPAFNDSSTIATWLDGAGYRTALIGKYLNQFSTFTDGSYVPPGRDRWVAFYSTGGGKYYNYQLSIDGQLHSYGDLPSDYSTDVLARQAVQFIHNTNTTRPFFLYFAPSAPHEPATPAPRDVGTFSGLAPWRPPNYNEADVSDKPAWVQAHPLLDAASRAGIDTLRKHQYETLGAVDDAVASIVGELAQSGRLANTMIVFASDNGYLWGEHRLTAKQLPYEESIRIPLVIRYDPLTTSSRRIRPQALNIDLAPTFADVAGVTPPKAVDGRSLLPLLAQTATSWRKSFLVEHLGPGIPTYCAVRSLRYTYVQYQTKEEELYDLTTDRFQLQNVARDPDYAQVLRKRRANLVTLCSPPPPGFTPFG
jgi:arylsulfatase A-like enzyme